jgi:hypothetical protein
MPKTQTPISEAEARRIRAGIRSGLAPLLEFNRLALQNPPTRTLAADPRKRERELIASGMSPGLARFAAGLRIQTP